MTSTSVTATVVACADPPDDDAHPGLLQHLVHSHDGTNPRDDRTPAIALFTSVGRAVDAAIALQRAAARLDSPLAPRIGISTGDLRTTDPDSRNPAIKEARHLSSIAAAGTILASRTVHLLADRDLVRIMESDNSTHGVVDAFVIPWQPTARCLRVVLADDAAVIRDGIAALLRDADIDVVATATNADELLAAVAEHRPDVAITDIRMPPTHTLEGLQAALQIRATHPDVAVLVLSQHIETRLAVDLLDGSPKSVGYLLKERIGDIDELTSALHRLVDGACVVDPDVVTRLVDRTRHVDPLAALSPRERAVLQLMAEGRANRAIAANLHLNTKTVESHVRAIFLKLGLPPETADDRRVIAVITYLRARPPTEPP